MRNFSVSNFGRPMSRSSGGAATGQRPPRPPPCANYKAHGLRLVQPKNFHQTQRRLGFQCMYTACSNPAGSGNNSRRQFYTDGHWFPPSPPALSPPTASSFSSSAVVVSCVSPRPVVASGFASLGVPSSGLFSSAFRLAWLRGVGPACASASPVASSVARFRGVSTSRLVAGHSPMVCPRLRRRPISPCYPRAAGGASLSSPCASPSSASRLLRSGRTAPRAERFFSSTPSPGHAALAAVGGKGKATRAAPTAKPEPPTPKESRSNATLERADESIAADASKLSQAPKASEPSPSPTASSDAPPPAAAAAEGAEGLQAVALDGNPPRGGWRLALKATSVVLLCGFSAVGIYFLREAEYNVAKAELLIARALVNFFYGAAAPPSPASLNSKFSLALPEELQRELSLYFIQLDIDKENGFRRSDALLFLEQVGLAADEAVVSRFIQAGKGKHASAKKLSGCTLQEFAELVEAALLESEEASPGAAVAVPSPAPGAAALLQTLQEMNRLAVRSNPLAALLCL
eukprot:GHVT01030058.1.p1 GENE.GHVT01030058.1~~GHVT01030058.1.p1  ORF type:complete len:519 (+),score=141.44 GHVT01030058.1:378-1934(+)